jgi:dynein intermediate chain 1
MPADLEKVATTYVKPLHQLPLSEAELREDVNRVLTAVNPQLPSNLVTFCYKERAYKPDPPLEQADLLTIHFAVEGSILHKDSIEAKQQAQWEEKRKEDMEQARRLALEEAVQAGEEAFFVGEEGKKGMRGGFKYCDRAAQTFNRPTKDKAVGSEPPPVLTFSATCNQWEIYDAYLREQRQQQQNSSSSSSSKGRLGGEDTQTVHSEKLGKSLQVLERMLTQNAEDEVFHDFKYWDDTADVSRVQGSLLQLWQFVTERTKRKQVTALAWNPRYHDLFAVGYGSYDFLRQGTGLICCFSLKNTATPQYSFSTEVGVMCLDFHPEHPYLLAVGCYDGTVLVFDVRLKANRPIYASTVTIGKHTDPVWKVRWQTLEEGLLAGTGSSLIGRELCFYSVASDGHVAAWLLSKNELKMEPVMQLKLKRGKGVVSIISSSSSTGPSNSGASSAATSILNCLDDEPSNLLTSVTGLASGSCFDFCPLSGQGHLFLVGTEEGTLHKCSKAYSGQYLATYEGGHHMAVYAVRWNPFHPKLFLSCSADWTVKLWDHTRPGAPLLSFDLGNAVGDVDWSPVSSTTFAAVTSDGRAHVFDLAANKHEPLCVQKVVKRAKLTHVAFNEHEPVLLVGDDRGEVTSLKLSPNLRNWHEPKDEAGNVLPHDTARLQYNNVEKLLAAVVGVDKGTGK